MNGIETFDLHVPETHEYVANGFVVHNTYEDVDLSLKLRSLGYKIYIDTNATAEHVVGGSVTQERNFPLQQNAQIFRTRWQNSGAFMWDDFKFF